MAAIVEHLHPETVSGLAGKVAPDSSCADYADSFPCDVVAEHVFRCPRERRSPADVVALNDSTSRSEQQRPREIRSCVGEHVGSVRDIDTFCVSGLHVNVVEPYAVIRNELQTWPGLRD